MTSSVKISAHCGSHKRVVATIKTANAAEEFIIHNGESREFALYDDRELTTREEPLDNTAEHVER